MSYSPQELAALPSIEVGPGVSTDGGSPFATGSAFEGVALPVLVVDRESWLVLAVNEAALRQYGYTREEFVGLPVVMVRPPDGRADAVKVLSEMPHGFWKITAVRHQRSDGSVFSADVWSQDTEMEGRPVRVATVADVTERVRLQSDLQNAQRMEVVGRLAGGVAHDFNNALTSVIGGAELLADLLEGHPEAVAELEEIRSAADRMVMLTRQLLAFSRRQVLRRRLASLSDLAKRAAELVRPVLGGHIRLDLEIDADAVAVLVDPVQIEQVLRDLALNAVEAMPDGGVLTVRTALRTVEPGGVVDGVAIPPGRYAECLVRDTGVGMDEVTRARIFEPFFSTKPPPQGTGLGLSTAHGVVAQSGGYITVASEPGRGALFRVLLPVAGEESAPVTPGGPVRGGATVLVVDEDEAVRRTTCRILEGLGHAAAGVAGAEEALETIASLDRPLDLLVVDIAVADPAGPAAAARLRQAAAGARVLFLAPRSPGPTQASPKMAEREGLLPKPFSLDELTQAVQRILAPKG